MDSSHYDGMSPMTQFLSSSGPLTSLPTSPIGKLCEHKERISSVGAHAGREVCTVVS